MTEVRSWGGCAAEHFQEASTTAEGRLDIVASSDGDDFRPNQTGKARDRGHADCYRSVYRAEPRSVDDAERQQEHGNGEQDIDDPR